MDPLEALKIVVFVASYFWGSPQPVVKEPPALSCVIVNVAREPSKVYEVAEDD